MRICVFGASGPVGRSVVSQALEAGHDVVAVTRQPDRWGAPAPRLHVLGGDVLDLAQVTTAIRGADAVISTTGVNPTRRPVFTYSVGIRNMIQAMRGQNVQRIVCVSSKQLDETGHQDEILLYRLVFARLLSLVNRTIYEDMRRMEDLLNSSDRDWTVIRPAGLFAADTISGYRHSTEHQPGVFTSTADLADALLSEAVRKSERGARVVQVLTDSKTPPYLLLLARQASMHRR